MADELTILTENAASDSWVDANPGAASTGYQAQNTNINANRNGIDLSYVRYDSGTDEIVIEESGPIDDNGLPFAVGQEIRFANPGAGTWYLRVIPGSTTVDRELEITSSKGTWDGSKNALYDSVPRRVLNWVIVGGSGTASVSKLIPLVTDLEDAYKGKNSITLSNYDNDSAPVVKTGSVFDNNGILVNVTSDATPTGYSGISVSTTFYLYWDESAGAFVYSSTNPTWSDSLQGWYSGNDRALFSMYKDSGGTEYQNKKTLIPVINTNMNGFLEYKAKRITSANYFHASGDENDLFDKLAPFIPNNGDGMNLNGEFKISAGPVTIASVAVRLSTTEINLLGGRADTGAVGTSTITNGSPTTLLASLSW